MRIGRISTLLLVVVLAGCVTPGIKPTSESLDRSRLYNAPFDQTWSAIIAVIAQENLPITTIEKDSGIIAISDVAYPPEWAREGTRGSVVGVPDLVTSRVAYSAPT